MAKNIIKELIIVLLLCLAIILILGILMYQYVPVAKTIPNPVSYTTPTEAKEELQESSEVNEEQIVMTYEINSSDLNNYKRTQDYKPGKANPFSSFETQTGSNQGNGTSNNTSNKTENSTTESSNSGNSNSGNSNNGNTTTSGGEYFQDKGTK